MAAKARGLPWRQGCEVAGPWCCCPWQCCSGAGPAGMVPCWGELSDSTSVPSPGAAVGAGELCVPERGRESDPGRFSPQCVRSFLLCDAELGFGTATAALVR